MDGEVDPIRKSEGHESLTTTFSFPKNSRTWPISSGFLPHTPVTYFKDVFEMACDRREVVVNMLEQEPRVVPPQSRWWEGTLLTLLMAPGALEIAMTITGHEEEGYRTFPSLDDWSDIAANSMPLDSSPGPPVREESPSMLSWGCVLFPTSHCDGDIQPASLLAASSSFACLILETYLMLMVSHSSFGS